MGEVIRWLLSGHDLTWWQYLVNALFALVGAATSGLAINPKFKLPSYDKGELDLGFVRLLLVGTLAGLALGHSPPIPFFAGMFAPVVLPLILEKFIPALLTTLQPLVLTLAETLASKKKGGES